MDTMVPEEPRFCVRGRPRLIIPSLIGPGARAGFLSTAAAPQPIPFRGSTKPRRGFKPSRIRDAEYSLHDADTPPTITITVPSASTEP